MSITFATLADALAARVRPVRLYARIGGVAVDVYEAHTSHGVDQAIGTCTVITAAPLPATATINAEIEIIAGYAGAVARVFHGVIPNNEAAIDDSGKIARIDGVGWASYLDWPETTGLEMDGPVSLKEAFRSLCASRGVPTYLADDTTYPDGTEIMLGGNDYVANGAVQIATRDTPLRWLTRAAACFGYRVFDSPDGTVRLARISGLPNEAVTWTYSQGSNAYRMTSRQSRDPMVTYWEVLGARYTTPDGVVSQIRSIPDEVPYAEELDPPGYRKDTFSETEVLVTETQAAGVRNVLEIDRSEVWQGETWDCAGNPAAQPGEVVSLTSAALGLSAAERWLTRIQHDVSDDGFITQMEGWSGAGEALAAGNDCITETIGAGPYHIGDETVSWYATAAATDPGDTGYAIAFTVTSSDYSSLRITGYAHGSNSWGSNVEENATTGSAIEVWQLADPALPESGTNEMTRKGSLELPVYDEEYSSQRDYATDLTHWQAFTLPVSGTLKAGEAELRLVAGDNVSGIDDYEVRDLTLTYCGVGEPTLPGSY